MFCEYPWGPMASPEYPYYICSEFSKKTKLSEYGGRGETLQNTSGDCRCGGNNQAKNPAEDKNPSHTDYIKASLAKTQQSCRVPNIKGFGRRLDGSCGNMAFLPRGRSPVHGLHSAKNCHCATWNRNAAEAKASKPAPSSVITKRSRIPRIS